MRLLVNWPGKFEIERVSCQNLSILALPYLTLNTLVARTHMARIHTSRSFFYSFTVFSLFLPRRVRHSTYRPEM